MDSDIISKQVKKLSDNLEKISIQLINKCGLLYSRCTDAPQNPLIRWLDFVSRNVAPQPRKIEFSTRFPGALNLLPEKNKYVYEEIKEKIYSGENINEYQTKFITKHHDTSHKKRQFRTDHLWAEWGVFHFHLSQEARSDVLLFCKFENDTCYFIDIRHHNEGKRSDEGHRGKKSPIFFNPALINVCIEDWPGLMEKYRLKNVLAPSVIRTPSEISELRKNGISNAVVFNGAVYYPGLGITTASTATLTSIQLNNIRKYLYSLSKYLFLNFPYHEDVLFSLQLTKNRIQIIYPNVMSEIQSSELLFSLNEALLPAWMWKLLKIDTCSAEAPQSN